MAMPTGGMLFYGWHYPPYFLFVATVLAEMPCGLALTVWQAATLALYLLVVWLIVFGRQARRGNVTYSCWRSPSRRC